MMEFSVMDAIFAALLVAGARVGLKRGFGEMVWPALAAALLATTGGATVGQLQDYFTTNAHLGPRAAGMVIYFAQAALVLLTIDKLKTLFGDRVATTLPAGPVDQGVGLVMGLVTVSGWILALICVLHPWRTMKADWNPADLHGVHPLGALFQALLGSMHHIVVARSNLARAAVDVWQPFLLPVP